MAYFSVVIARRAAPKQSRASEGGFDLYQGRSPGRSGFREGLPPGADGTDNAVAAVCNSRIALMPPGGNRQWKRPTI